MVNGKDKNPLEIIIPPQSPPLPPVNQKACHRFFAPIAIPEQDPLNPHRANVTPRLGNFPCILDRCMMWNEQAGECWEKTAAKGQAMAGQYAFNMMNDVSVPNSGS